MDDARHRIHPRTTPTEIGHSQTINPSNTAGEPPSEALEPLGRYTNFHAVSQETGGGV